MSHDIQKIMDDMMAGLDGMPSVEIDVSELLGTEHSPATDGKAPVPVLTYRPFPVKVLPPPIRRLVVDGAASIDCDPAYIALPLLAAIASAIGNSRVVRLKEGWTEPAVLWLAVVALSGTHKSPAYMLAMRAIERRQAELWRRYQDGLRDYQERVKEWRKLEKKDRGEEPEPPEACQHVYCGEATVEALLMRLQQQSRGLLVKIDELAGLFKGFNAYKSTGSDRETYLSFHGAQSAKIDRKTAIPPMIYIPRAFVAIFGGIQPDILRREMSDEFFDSGFTARFLFAHPPESKMEWRDDTVAGDVHQAVADVFERLWAMPMRAGEFDAEPHVIGLTDAARSRWIEFFNLSGAEQYAMTDNRLKAAWSKLRGYAARLALVLHGAACASEVRGIDEWTIDDTSMAGGIALADWFGHEAKRVYATMRESKEARQDRELVDLIRSKGGQVTVRILQQTLRKYCEDREQAEADLDRLAQAGLGRWETARQNPKGGRQPRIFHLFDDDTETAKSLAVPSDYANDTPAGDSTDDGNVDVDAVDARENGRFEGARAGRERGKR